MTTTTRDKENEELSSMNKYREMALADKRGHIELAC